MYSIFFNPSNVVARIIMRIGAGLLLLFSAACADNSTDNTPHTDANSTQISDIRFYQTHANTGTLEYSITADSFEQSSDGAHNILHNMRMLWHPDGDASQNYTITATRTHFNQNTQDIEVFDGFVITRNHNNGNTKYDTDNTQSNIAQETSPLVLTGNTFYGNMDSQKITITEAVEVVQAQNYFTAQSANLDLAKGEYVFNQIQVQFDPAVRMDKNLF